MILFRCKCGEELEAAEHEAGRRLMCPVCLARCTVPRPGETAESNPAAVPSTAVQPSPAVGPTLGPDAATTSAAQPRPPSSRWAALSLALGLLSFLVPILCIPGIILGVMGVVEIRRSEKRLAGLPLAIAGIFCSILVPVLILFLVLLFQDLRQEAADTISKNHLRQIALAIETHHDIHKTFPQQAIYGADGRPLLSWRVAILSYIEQHDLYLRFKLDEPWDSPHNMELLSRMPSIYKAPDRTDESTTVYQGFVGKNAFFRSSPEEQVSHGDIKDGAANTLMVVQAEQAVPWTKPEDLPYDSEGPLPRLAGHAARGSQAVLVDGSVVRLDRNTLSDETLRRAITINDGQPLGLDWPAR